ncbi:MAG: hypothetical protein AAF066_13880 [Pseudomonadota bacterium]
MKVKITQEKQKAGLLGGKTEWQTTMLLTLSEEEKAVVSSGNIGGITIAALPTLSRNDEMEYTAEQLMSQPVSVMCNNQWYANEVAKRLKDAAAELKRLLDETTADETGEYEL